jgi:NDP-sugar pyrophosphorylase family protein
MHAVIMAGGRGTRLASCPEALPKPLAPVGDRPIIDILLSQFRCHGVSEVTIALGHKGDQVRAAVGCGDRFGLSIDYVSEVSPLGTCGALGGLLDRVGERFVLANGDLLTDLNLSRMIAQHDATGSDATLGVFRQCVTSPFGVLTIGPDGRIVRYDEKPPQSLDVSMGVYVLRRDAVRPFLAPGVAKDAPALISDLIAHGARVTAFREAQLWIDIGTPSDYLRAKELLACNPGLLGGGP